jgi:hypothetical protein
MGWLLLTIFILLLIGILKERQVFMLPAMVIMVECCGRLSQYSKQVIEIGPWFMLAAMHIIWPFVIGKNTGWSRKMADCIDSWVEGFLLMNLALNNFTYWPYVAP